MVEPTLRSVDEMIASVPPISVDSQLAFYYSLGMSLSQWAMVERTLELVAKTLVKGNAAFGVGFERLGSLEAKIKFIDAAIAALNQEDWSQKWFDKTSGLRKALKGYTEIRNKLAHWQVVPVTQDSHPL